MNSKLFLVLFALFLKLSRCDCPSDDDATCDEVPKQPTQKLAPISHSCGCSGVFVNTYKVRIVFDWWLCEQGWQYALTLVGLFGLGMLSPCLKAYREILRSKAIRSYIYDCLLTHLFLFVFALFVYMLDFLLMLIVMSFNVGVFIAVTVGYSVGYVLSSMAYSSYRNSRRHSEFTTANEDCC